MRRAWRLVKRRYSASAFDGEGARLNGARWSSVGTRAAYASDSKALAVLEVLVHLQTTEVLAAYVFVGVDIPESLIEVLDRSALLAGWTDSPPPVEVQAIGDQWIGLGKAVVLAVPSAVVPDAVNYLLNPAHPRFSELKVSEQEPFVFDHRLLRHK